MTDKIKCEVCNGSGHAGPKQADDTPSMDRIIGCAPCSFCKGGYREAFEWTDDMQARLGDALKVEFDKEQAEKDSITVKSENSTSTEIVLLAD